MNRRGFLSLFCAAPFAAPALAKEAARGMASGSYMRGVSGYVGEMTTGETIKTLGIKLDTSALDPVFAQLKEMQQMQATLESARRVVALDEQAVATWDGVTVPTTFGEITADDSALIAPNRLKGSTINQDGDAT